MKINEIILLEVIEPRKPSTTKSSTRSKSGVQGSTIKIADRTFSTDAGNLVTVSFKPNVENGEKSVDISFYVNGTTEDNATSGRTDGKILSGVLYIILQYLNRSRVNHCTFIAAPGERDNKKIYNIDKTSIVDVVKNCIGKLKNRILHTVVTPQQKKESLDKTNALLLKLGRPLVTKIEYINKKELVNALDVLFTKISDISAADLNDCTMYIQNNNKNVDKWIEYIELMDSIYKLHSSLISQTPGGLNVHKNRRLELYTKMVNHYFAHDWDIDIYGTSFRLVRKNKK